MIKEIIAKLEEWYANGYQSKLKGLRILNENILLILKTLSQKFEVSILGHSENGLPIHKIKIGSGAKRILIWSQMHGNESTGTKALFDLLNFLEDAGDLSDVSKNIKLESTIVIIPMLNPDGAREYTRENAKGVDLNRDAVALEAIESKLLRKELDSFQPHFCFNLHDQRTIFNVEGTRTPATLSFLAPSIDFQRSMTDGRKQTMAVIVAMNKVLQQIIPNAIGRYTDEFYPTATGDNFQKLGHNTILIEAGHFKDDYEREKVRKFNFIALVSGLQFLASNSDYDNYMPYFDIPNNDKKYFDIIYKNALYIVDGKEISTDLGVLFKYKVLDNSLLRYETVEKIGDLVQFYGHQEIDLKNNYYKSQ